MLFAGAGLLRTLDRLGFSIPATLQAAADEGRPLSRVTGFKIDVHDLDERFKLFDVGFEKRLQFKCALTNAGLL